MLEPSVSQNIIDILLNHNYKRPNTALRPAYSRSRSVYQSRPIEQSIFMKNLLRVNGVQSRKQFRLTTQQFLDSQQTNQKVSQKVVLKNSQSHVPDQSIRVQTQPELSPQYKTRRQRSSQSQSRSNHRVVPQENSLQKQRYSVLHVNFIKLMKQYRNMYGIPISEFVAQHKFLTLIDQSLMYKLLSIFNIDSSNPFDIVSFQQFKEFKSLIVWKDANVIILIDCIMKIFENLTGGQFLEQLNKIRNIQPYKYAQNIKQVRDKSQINSYVDQLVEICIQNVISNGNFNFMIDVSKFRNLFIERQIYINDFIDLVSGQV